MKFNSLVIQLWLRTDGWAVNGQTGISVAMRPACATDFKNTKAIKHHQQIPLTLCMLGFNAFLLWSANFIFQNFFFFQKNNLSYLRNTITVSKGLDRDQD